MNDTKVASKAKAQLANFMGKVFTHFSRPGMRFIEHYHPIGFSRRGAERQSSQRTSNFRSLLSLMQTALKFLDEKINFSPVLSVLSASLREIYTGCY